MKQIILFDCAVRLAPKAWRRDKKIDIYYKKHQRMPLVNASEHQHLLANVSPEKRMDRPDILHFGLLLALNMAKLVDEVEILFTIGRQVHQISPETRLPRDQNRFYGVMSKYLSTGENPFIKKLDEKLEELLLPTVWFFTRGGNPGLPTEVPKDLSVIFGARSIGTPIPPKANNIRSISLHSEGLELWTAMSLGLPHSLGIDLVQEN